MNDVRRVCLLAADSVISVGTGRRVKIIRRGEPNNDDPLLAIRLPRSLTLTRSNATGRAYRGLSSASRAGGCLGRHRAREQRSRCALLATVSTSWRACVPGMGFGLPDVVHVGRVHGVLWGPNY